jgi:hypothetical protein
MLNGSICAQNGPIKLGKIDKKILENNVYEKDSSANAVILSDYGKAYFEFDTEGKKHFYYTRQVRIKILNKNGFDWADWEISLYIGKHGKEKLLKVKGYTYNLVDGKVEKTKLGNDIFEINYDKNHDLATFTFPKVREGSVIDLEYEISSPFYFSIDPWYFQYEIPVVRSEFYFESPDFYTYSKFMRGYVGLIVSERYVESKSVTIVNKRNDSRSQISNNSNRAPSSQVNVTINEEHFVAENVPAFIKEKPLSSVNNYISKIEFELSSYNPKNATGKVYSTTWADINKQLLNNENFGYDLKGGRAIYGSLKPIAGKINQEYSDPHQRMIAAYNYVSNNMKWNNFTSIYVNTNLKKPFNDKKGNVAEINMILIALLRELDIEAYPLVGSTRNTGFLLEEQPKLTQLNYLTVQAIIDNKQYLMDATSNYIPCGTLPVKALNNRAWLVDETKSGWIDLTPTKKYKTYQMINVQMDESGDMKGGLQGAYSGYAAIELRNKVKKMGSEEAFIKSVIEQYDGFSFDSFNIIDLDSIYKPVKSTIKVEVADQSMGAGNRIYFNPMMFDKIKSNPFKLKERLYPVEYDFKEDETYILNLNIPPGFSVEEVPENIKIVLPENGGSFIFQVKQMGGMLQVLSRIRINKLLFLPSEYDFLKEFYEIIIEKHAEQIVLVKSEGQ